MHLYMDKLTKILPVVQQKQLVLEDRGPKITIVKMEFLPETDFYLGVPYLQELEEARNNDGNEKRIFLVSEEDNIAIKTAYNYIIYPFYEMKDEILEDLSEHLTADTRLFLKDQDGADIKLRIISMHGEKSSDISSLQYQLLNTGITEDSFVFYNGLEDNTSLRDKLDVILTSPAKVQFVQVTKEQL